MTRAEGSSSVGSSRMRLTVQYFCAECADRNAGGGEVGRKPTAPARPGADYGIAAVRAGVIRKERLPALAAVQCSARRE